MFRVHVPATSGNLCVGFDSTGLAINIYNSIDFSARESGVVIENDRPALHTSSAESNLIVRAARAAAQELGMSLPGLYIKQYDRIPSTRGLGSSAACIVGGILIADRLLGAHMPRQQILALAAQMEGGFPDNAAAALYGGICISTRREDGSFFTRSIPVARDLELCVIVPQFSLPTQKARGVLPRMVKRSDAAFNVANMGLLVSALYEREYKLLRLALRDRLHEPYRKPLIEGYDEVCELAISLGAYATCLSGSGPSILAFIPAALPDYAGKLNDALRTRRTPGRWRATQAEFDRRGATVEML